MNTFNSLNGNSSSYEKDYLTGLPNRQSLYRYYATLDNHTDMVHAMFIDVDHFKRVNDTYGHSMGDHLLIAISSYIQQHLTGFISRIGGDEFVAILDGTMSKEQITQTARILVDGFRDMDFRNDILSMISLSVGVIMSQPTSQSLDDILSKCDTAMYQAKYDGRNRCVIYESTDTAFENNFNIEAEMEDALANGEFVVYLQPKINMVTSALSGAEALSRWVHPKDGIRSPISYIPLFEKNGFISNLDLYIFEEVCKIKASWKGLKYEHIPISINMSRLHLYNEKFPETLLKISQKYGVSQSELELEITENIFIKDSIELIETVNNLKSKGFMVSIDDFGSGFSALSLLKDLQVDTIKIDKEFLRDSSNNPRGRKVLRNVIAMCKDLKMDVVTEGVETKDQIHLITSFGCQIAQGFYYSKPLALQDFHTFANEFTNNPVDSHNFRMNGNLLTEDGTLEGQYQGSGFKFVQGIFRNSNALYFPGGPQEQNTVLLPKNTILNDSYTISVWLKPKASHLWTSAIWVKFETGFCSLLPLAWEGHSSFRIRDSKDINGWYDVSGAPLQEGFWNHYAVSYNAKTETATAYINGDVVGIVENVPTNRYVMQIMLGGDTWQPSYVGNMCELNFYNEVKDHDFIKSLFESYLAHPDFMAYEDNDHK